MRIVKNASEILHIRIKVSRINLPLVDWVMEFAAAILLFPTPVISCETVNNDQIVIAPCTEISKLYISNTRPTDMK